MSFFGKCKKKKQLDFEIVFVLKHLKQIFNQIYVRPQLLKVFKVNF